MFLVCFRPNSTKYTAPKPYCGLLWKRGNKSFVKLEPVTEQHVLFCSFLKCEKLASAKPNRIQSSPPQVVVGASATRVSVVVVPGRHAGNLKRNKRCLRYLALLTSYVAG